MALDVYKALKQLKKGLTENWSNITFDFEIKGEDDSEEAWATASVTLKGFDDDIRLIFTAHSGGGVEFRAVFDELDLNYEVLELLNAFNEREFYFKLYVRSNGYLEVNHDFVCDDPTVLVEYVGECLSRLADLSDDEIMQALTAHTH